MFTCNRLCASVLNWFFPPFVWTTNVTISARYELGRRETPNGTAPFSESSRRRPVGVRVGWRDATVTGTRKNEGRNRAKTACEFRSGRGQPPACGPRAPGSQARRSPLAIAALDCMPPPPIDRRRRTLRLSSWWPTEKCNTWITQPRPSPLPPPPPPCDSRRARFYGCAFSTTADVTVFITRPRARIQTHTHTGCPNLTCIFCT